MRYSGNIRRRIRRRQYERIHPRVHNRIFSFVFRSVLISMVIAILCLGLLINEKIGLVALPKQLSSINFGMISEWLPFENWFSLKDETVSATPSYHLLKDDMYANGTNQATAILPGVVMHVQQTTTKKYSVTIQHDNGVIATYSLLNSSDLKQDERILKGAVLGSYQDALSIVFMKDNKKVDFNTAVRTS